MGPVTGPGGRAQSASAYRRARGLLGRVEAALLSVAAVAILAMTCYVTLGIVLRTFFNMGLVDEIVIVGEMMVATIALPFAFCAAERSFIAIEVFTAWAGRRARIWLDVLASFVGLAALVPITIAGVSSGLKAWTEGSYFFGILNLPEWPGYFVYSIGIGVFLLRLIDLLVHDLLCALGAIEDDDPSRARP